MYLFSEYIKKYNHNFLQVVFLLNTMKQDTIQISKKEYKELKALESLKEFDADLIKKTLKALKNFEEGKFKEWI